MDRVQEVAQGEAELLSNDTAVLFDEGTSSVTLVPSAVISFQGLCLVLDAQDGQWYLGRVAENQAIVCWAAYGADLEEAIRAL